MYSYHLFLISSASVRYISFLSFIEPIIARNVPLVCLIFLKRSLVCFLNSLLQLSYVGKRASLVTQMVRNLHVNAGDPSSILESGRSPGEGNGNHSIILAWKIPWTEEPGGLHGVTKESDTT